MLDLAGNALRAVSTTFTTESGADFVRPTVALVSPPNGMTEVATNVLLQLEFSERVNPLTVTPSTFFLERLVNSTAQRVLSRMELSADGLSVTLIPDQPLAPRASYRLRTSTSIQDVAGNGLSGSTVLTSFTTGTGEDTTDPMVQQINIADGVLDVAVNAEVVIELDEPVDVTSVSEDTVVVSSVGIEVMGSVLLSGDGRTLTFIPEMAFETSTEFTVTVSGVVDWAGNLVTDYSSSFTTSASAIPDTIRPTVSGVMPSNGSVDVPVDTVIEVQFSERLDPLTVTDSTFYLDRINSVRVSGDLALSADGLTVTFTPTEPLVPANDYRIRSSSGILDLAGNSGNVATILSSFTTAEGAADTTSPQVLAITPSDCLIYTSPSPRDQRGSRMPSSA